MDEIYVAPVNRTTIPNVSTCVRGNSMTEAFVSVFTGSHGSETTRTAATLVRPIDAMERMFYRYGERNPVNFLIVAEFGIVLAEEQLKTALMAIQQRHPLLSVHVEDRCESRLGFYRAEPVAPIELAVYERDGLQWQLLAAEELARPFGRSRAPLMRAVLLKGPSNSAVLLTFEHTIADGISSVMILRDLVAWLNGHHLIPLGVPPSQEEMTALRLTSSEHQPTPEPAVPDARMLRPSSIRPFDGARSHVHTVTLNGLDTSRLVRRCRTERTTVHAAIVTAASRVRARLRGEDFVRVVSPINIRALTNAGDACADYIADTVTGMAPRDGSAFWDQARAVTAELATARSASVVATMPAMMRQTIPVDAETNAAEEFLTTCVPWDLMISNLGVQDLAVSGSIRPTAVWGPILNTHIHGDSVTGVITYQGRLRMVACGYTPTADYLETLAATLVQVTS